MKLRKIEKSFRGGGPWEPGVVLLDGERVRFSEVEVLPRFTYARSTQGYKIHKIRRLTDNGSAILVCGNMLHEFWWGDNIEEYRAPQPPYLDTCGRCFA